MSQIKLSTGKLIEVTDPLREIHKIDADDVFQCLDKIIRFNGQHPHKISVLFHSYLTSRLAAHFGENPLIQLFCLFHDAPEIILSDIPSPVKKALGSEYFNLEDDWAEGMFSRFVGSQPEDYSIIKRYDEMAYQVEVGLWAMASFISTGYIGFHTPMRPEEASALYSTLLDALS